MRVGHAWHKQLAKDIAALRETSYGPLPIAVSRFLDIELVLTLLRNYFPDEAPEHAWAILNGYRFPAYASLCGGGLRVQAIARLRLPRLLSASAWERDLTAMRRKVRLASGELAGMVACASAARLFNLLQICSRFFGQCVGDHAGSRAP